MPIQLTNVHQVYKTPLYKSNVEAAELIGMTRKGFAEFLLTLEPDVDAECKHIISSMLFPMDENRHILMALHHCSTHRMSYREV